MLSPTKRSLVFDFPFQVKKAADICQKVVQAVDKPFIWRTTTLENDFLDVYYEDYHDIHWAIHEILSIAVGKENFWEIARTVCDEDVEWSKWRNKDLNNKYYYKYILKPEYATLIRSAAQKWHDDLIQILAEMEAEEKREREEREARRNSLKCEVLKQKKVRGGDGIDLCALVHLTDPKTGESLQFECRNIFDVGYVINPNYPIAEGMEPGGIEIEGKWHDFDEHKGWYPVRELTEFEKRCLAYLREFPPIYNGIRM